MVDDERRRALWLEHQRELLRFLKLAADYRLEHYGRWEDVKNRRRWQREERTKRKLAGDAAKA